MRIIFMGTPDFAVASLKALVEAGCNVVAVLTAPDKPAGRGRKLRETPVKIYAASQNIPVLQPPRLKNPDFIKELESYKADLQVVVAFRMLPEVVWAMPKMGTFNLHGSLLPQYRGAAPINWAVINGETETGVTTFFIEKEIDTGKLIFSEKTLITDKDNAGTVHDKLMEMGADLVLKTVRAIEGGSYPQIEQDENHTLKPAPKIFKEDCQINWQQDAKTIHDFIRGLSPFPGAWAAAKIGLSDEESKVKIFAAKVAETGNKLTVGQLDSDNKTFLHIGTKNGTLAVENIQVPGKKRLAIDDFLRGYDVTNLLLISGN